MSKKSPQLRFEGFTYNWEERRLSEVLRERNNQQPQSMEYPLVSFTVENGVTPKTDRYEREQLVVGDKSSKKYKVTVLNDIVYNPANLKFGAISRNKYGNAVFSPIYVTFSVNNDVTMPEFIEMLITRKDFIKRALKYQQGTVYERQSVSPENLLSMNLYLPGKLEQEKIGTFFKHLDDTISLQQRKLDLLKEQKKGYLQKMFPKNGAKVPELRFAGFVDDWEQRKLGEMLVNLEAGVSVNSSDYDTGYFILKTSAIKMGNIDLLEVKSIVSEEVARAKTPLIKNSIIISRMNTPELVGASGLVRESIDNIFLPDRLWQGQVAGNFSPEWLIQSINIAANIKKIRDLATGTSGSMKNISKKSMLDLIINVPTLEEQQKIGSFFKQLDDVIALHQRKLDLLKEQKKGFLQKMFV
ncbi:restriction endonuclease subunit S (plasmid) [Lactococcus lactis]|nr:restriction endonuclease subunit S [Lactococcus lactis]RQD98439.1 restriction endonuclease subunit S [Lactococcus lactis]RQE03821.1 restriction endonuclease subunit S [Lactococcus lactis]RQE07479.1 restriction endonuclease subunit S [Lactococcus lactis]RQE08808.1 restriction endonuclease subunit S [Lactococcus lactis]RQE10826.1 restriction endonuclease subunit S [Lactococcus lactis]